MDHHVDNAQTSTLDFPYDLERNVQSNDRQQTKSSSGLFIHAVLYPLILLYSYFFTLYRQLSRHLRFWDDNGDGRNLVPHRTGEANNSILRPGSGSSVPSLLPSYTPFIPSLSERTRLLSSDSSCSNESVHFASTSSSGRSSPSSSAPSYHSLRSCLKKTAQQTHSRSLPIAIGTKHIQYGSIVASPPPAPLKNVRFNEEKQLREFEIEGWEAAFKSTVALGRWHKDGKTIVWQDGPEGRSSSPTRSWLTDEDEWMSGKGFCAWLLGSGARNMLSSSMYSTSSLGFGTGVAANSTDPPSRKNYSYGDETRWREGIF